MLTSTIDNEQNNFPRLFFKDSIYSRYNIQMWHLIINNGFAITSTNSLVFVCIEELLFIGIIVIVQAGNANCDFVIK